MKILTVLLVTTILASMTQPAEAAPRAATANAKPPTIPALQEWTGGTGTFALGSRIVRSSADAAALATTSQVFADDVAAQTGRTLAQVTGTPADLQPGDVFLSLGSTDTGLGNEGYALEIADRIRITARTDAGAFYGTRTVLQLLRREVPQGSARDWVLKPERGLMVDNGRKFFTPAWLRRHVKELAYLKLNTLHLHLSDNQGFRIESTTHPEVVSSAYLTKQQVTELIALAARYKITVVPEIDMPGHMAAILENHPDLQLRNQSGVPSYGFIDVSKDAAYTLMADLINEYLPLFPGPYWHIGADEYVTEYNSYPHLLTYARAKYGATAIAKDAYLGFINWANTLVRNGGKTTRAWNDGIGGGSAVRVNPNVAIEFWMNAGLTARQHVDNGHAISNQSWDPTYYVLGNVNVVRPNTTWGYETWHPDLFQGDQTVAGASTGSNLHVWCDFPNTQTEDQISAGIREPLRMLSQRLWGSPKPVATWPEFQSVIAAVGRNPDWSRPAAGNLAAGRPVAVSSTETPGFPGSFAVDSDTGTRWSSGYTDGEWIQVDLGSTMSIHRVRLSWETAFGRGYQVQASYDGSTWNTIHATTTGDGGIDDLTNLTGSGRFVRVLGTARGTQWGYSLWELEVYGSTNLALNRPTTASSVEPATSFTAALATDGNGGSRWSSGYTDPQWIQVDLGQIRPVNRVRLSWETAYGRAYQVQTSTDGTAWTTIYATTTGDGGIDDLTGLTGSGRYVRVLGTARSTQWGYSLWELEVIS